MVPLHHRTKLTESGEESPPVPPPPHRKGGWGEDAPFKNCAKKLCVGTTNAILYTPFCTDVTSLCAPLAIEGHTDGDGDTKPAPVVVEIKGTERGEKGDSSVSGNHHGTRTTGGSCRRRLLQMRAPVIVQDHVVWLPSGGPQLRVLSVSGAVRQCRAPNPAGQAADDARETRGRRGAAEGEAATGAA